MSPSEMASDRSSWRIVGSSSRPMNLAYLGAIGRLDLSTMISERSPDHFRLSVPPGLGKKKKLGSDAKLLNGHQQAVMRCSLERPFV
jgi:hypothetical protein